MTASRIVPLLLWGLWTGTFGGCNKSAEASSPEALLELVREACAGRDAGAIMAVIDRDYADDLGGPGRLEDDLRQLFTVYGTLDLRVKDVVRDGSRLRGFAVVEGRAMRYQGPLVVEFVFSAMGPLIRSGLLTDLRGVIDTLRQRRIAIERGSIGRIDAVISMEYRGKDGDRESLMRRLRESFRDTHDSALIVRDVDIAVEQDRARVLQSYLLVTHVEHRTVERRDRERLILRKEGTRWRIIDGLG